MTAEEIRNGRYEYKIQINTKVLERNLSKLTELNNILFSIGPSDAIANAEGNKRIICDFINNKGERVLTFTFGHGRYIYLNSIIVQREIYLRNFLGYFLNDEIEFYRDYPEIKDD
jgi:hypothetical protein